MNRKEERDDADYPQEQRPEKALATNYLFATIEPN